MADHPIYAAVYDRMLAASEARGLAGRREDLLAQARGRVLEVGAGTGLNLAHYRPDRVSSLVALEPDGAMRRQLLRRLGAGESQVPCQVHEAAIGEADFDPASFDTVVCTLVLCTVPDPHGAVRSLRRWLVPDGRLLFLEHVLAQGLTGRLQWAAAPLWRHLAGGCHVDRDTVAVLRAADMAITDCERFALPAGGPLMSSCVQGVARPRPVVADGGGQ